MNSGKSQDRLHIRESVDLIQRSTALQKSVDYSETEDSLNPGWNEGFSLENHEQMGLCSFYDFCLANKGYEAQTTCLKANNIVCQHRLFVRNLSE